MRRVSRLIALVLAAAVLAAAGCGSDDEPVTPAACLGPASAYLDALEDAPGEVRLEGATAISDCIVPAQEPGPLAQAGDSMVGAATRLNREIRSDFDERATVQLGYLVGAVQEGAAATGGIHEDLILRLDAAARFSGDEAPFGSRFERAFGEGYAAGLDHG
jgi:hypothetical protein